MEIAQTIKKEDLLGQFAELSGLKIDSSIIESVLASLKRYFEIVTSDPWLLPTDLSKQSQKT